MATAGLAVGLVEPGSTSSFLIARQVAQTIETGRLPAVRPYVSGDPIRSTGIGGRKTE
jgi:hypothetical protein